MATLGVWVPEWGRRTDGVCVDGGGGGAPGPSRGRHANSGSLCGLWLMVGRPPGVTLLNGLFASTHQ